MQCAYNTEEPTDYTSNKGREIKFRTGRPDQKFLKEVFMARIMAKTGEKEFPLPLHHVCKSHFLIDEDDPNCYFICVSVASYYRLSIIPPSANPVLSTCYQHISAPSNFEHPKSPI